MPDSLDLCSLPDGLIYILPAFAVEEMGREEGVYECTLSEPALSYDHNIEAESSFEKYVLNLAGNPTSRTNINEQTPLHFFERA